MTTKEEEGERRLCERYGWDEEVGIIGDGGAVLDQDGDAAIIESVRRSMVHEVQHMVCERAARADRQSFLVLAVGADSKCWEVHPLWDHYVNVMRRVANELCSFFGDAG